MTFNFDNLKCGCQGEGSYLWKPSTDSPRGCRRGSSFHWRMSHNSNGRLGMRRIWAKFMSRLLTDDHNYQRVSVSSPATRRGFTIITLKPNSSPHNERVLLRHAPERHRWAHMWSSVDLFCRGGIVHYEFAPRGQMVNQAYYLEFLKRLRNALRKKQSEMRPAGNVSPPWQRSCWHNCVSPWRNVQFPSFLNLLFAWPVPSQPFSVS
jgi:hypothetical protein